MQRSLRAPPTPSLGFAHLVTSISHSPVGWSTVRNGSFLKAPLCRRSSRPRAGIHHQSKAAGEEAAYHSPWFTSAGTGAQENRSSSYMTGIPFASARQYRAAVPEGNLASATVAGPSPSSRKLPVSAKRCEPLSCVVSPRSELAYRHRLQYGRLDSIVTLIRAPYAPRPLQVVLDVLAEIDHLQHSLCTGVAVNLSDHERAAIEATLRGLTAALSRRTDIALLLRDVVHEVQEVVTMADEVGDNDSAVELRDIVMELEGFYESIRNRMSRSSSNEGTDSQAMVLAGDASSYPLQHWRLPDTVYAEILHAVLSMMQHTGSHVSSIHALEELICLCGVATQRAELRSQHEAGRVTTADLALGGHGRETEEETFSLDTVVNEVDSELQSCLSRVTASDHVAAMESCARAKDFDAAYSLYRRFMLHAEAGYFAVGHTDLSSALIALAHSCRNAAHFAEVQEMLVKSEAGRSVPVTVPLYTALIEAVSRAVENPQRMNTALALYRRLRDTSLVPTVDTYAALIACCASTREATHAFAFYHEARQVCGVAAFTPRVYTNLLLSYARAGYGADARKMLDVLAEAGAPLNRSAFHAVLSGAVTLREAQEVLETMVHQYRIAPTPNTYAFIVHAASRVQSGVQTALQLYDLHEEASKALLDHGPTQGNDMRPTSTSVGTANSQALYSPSAHSVEAAMLMHAPLYVQAIEWALMRLRVDPLADSRLRRYLTPLVRLAQQRMNNFTEMAPQVPTLIPSGRGTSVAVLAADVLVNLEEWVVPLLPHFSAVVIPYSSLLALQVGQGKRVDGQSAKGPRAAVYDKVWYDAGSEQLAMVEYRRRDLVRFLQKNKDVVHLVSLEEELLWSRDTRRYGISSKDWLARAAAFAVNLSRTDVAHGLKLYAEEADLIVLVSTKYHHCGRYVVDLKRSYLATAHEHKCGYNMGVSSGLLTGLAKVHYHNPRAYPNWEPPTVRTSQSREAEHAVGKTDCNRLVSEDHAAARALKVMEVDEAAKVYRSITQSSTPSCHHEELLAAAAPLPDGNSLRPSSKPRQLPVLEEILDAELLMSALAQEST